jgi:hypothetical protein
MIVMGVVFKKKPTIKVGFIIVIRLFSTKNLIAGITKARDNIPVLVQPLVNRCGVKLNVRVRFFQCRDAFRRRDQDQNLDAVTARKRRSSRRSRSRCTSLFSSS